MGGPPVIILGGPTLASHRCTMCSGKLAYRSLEVAEMALAEIQNDPHTSRIPDRAYFENRCGWWHLTSKPLKRRKS